MPKKEEILPKFIFFISNITNYVKQQYEPNESCTFTGRNNLLYDSILLKILLPNYTLLVVSTYSIVIMTQFRALLSCNYLKILYLHKL